MSIPRAAAPDSPPPNILPVHGIHFPSQCRQDLRQRAKSVQVIHGVNAEIADGEFIVIVGPSGCGKSTLLRMVAGLEEISGGEIAIGGRVVNQLEPSRARHRDGVPELRALPAHERVRQHGLRPEDRKKVPRTRSVRVDKAARSWSWGTCWQPQAA
jgi:sn-glycerol 3-phosphate transport system ATP-binding protein